MVGRRLGKKCGPEEGPAGDLEVKREWAVMMMRMMRGQTEIRRGSEEATVWDYMATSSSGTGNRGWVQWVVATADEGSGRKTKGAGQRCVSDGHDRLWANETGARARLRTGDVGGRGDASGAAEEDETRAAAAGDEDWAVVWARSERC
jgi:hypothetical protein